MHDGVPNAASSRNRPGVCAGHVCRREFAEGRSRGLAWPPRQRCDYLRRPKRDRDSQLPAHVRARVQLRAGALWRRGAHPRPGDDSRRLRGRGTPSQLRPGALGITEREEEAFEAESGEEPTEPNEDEAAEPLSEPARLAVEAFRAEQEREDRLESLRERYLSEIETFEGMIVLAAEQAEQQEKEKEGQLASASTSTAPANRKLRRANKKKASATRGGGANKSAKKKRKKRK